MTAPAPAAGAPLPELLRELRGSDDTALWRAVAARVRDGDPDARARLSRRSVSLAVLSTHTADFLAELLPAAALSVGVDLRVHLAPFGQVDQQLLSVPPGLRAAAPDYVLLTGTVEDLGLRTDADPDQVVPAAVGRWRGLWHRAASELGARVLQHTFVPAAEDVYGVRSAQVPHSESAQVARINAGLVAAGGDGVLFVDVARIAAQRGLRAWRDPRYWHALRQAVSLEALPEVARAVAGVLAADLGLTRRCLVVDLDNTLWGGVLAEEGMTGVQVGGGVGGGATGEAYARFQDYLAALRGTGLTLAISSKNDLSLVERAFDEIPGMRLRQDDFACVVADWRPKSEQLREIADRLNLGLDSLAFFDDNPAERAQVAAALPDVDVIPVPAQPAHYIRALADRPTLQVGRLTAEDRARSASYAGLREAERLRGAATTLQEFLDSLDMRSRVRPLEPGTLARAEQLTHKTNQFNLTTVRRTRTELAGLMADPSWRCLTLSLRDTLADHGVVGLAIVRLDGRTATVDTLLLSCRVIGREAERRLLAVVAEAASAAGCLELVGRYRPTERNGLVRDLYPDLGFHPLSESAGECRYRLELPASGLDTAHITEEST